MEEVSVNYYKINMDKTISVKELQEKLKKKDPDQKMVCIDVRSEDEHEAAHIDGTINIPLDQLKMHAGDLKKYDEIYLHCNSGSRSEIACNVLSECGIGNYCDVDGGIMAWRREGLPVEGKNKKRMPLIRQVMITGGSLILFAMFMGLILHPAFYIVAWGVGFGFLYGGASGNCLMMKFLAKMPWNAVAK